MNLIRKPHVHFEKVAYTAKLEGEPSDWPKAILTESYKQLPFLTDSSVEVELDRSDSARGYGVGKLVVWPPGVEKRAAADASQLLTIPIIIRDRELAPLDVFSHQGHMRPLSREKIASIMHRPQQFVPTQDRSPRESSALGMAMSPPTERYGHSATAMHKSASALDAYVKLCPSVRQIEKLAKVLEARPEFRLAVTHSPLLRASFEKLSQAVELPGEKIAAALLKHTIVPDVAQYRFDGGKYFLKTAAAAAFDPTEQEVSVHEINKTLPATLRARLVETGSLTLQLSDSSAAGPVKIASMSGPSAIGVYEVETPTRTGYGLVVPHVVSLEGDSLGGSLFVGPQGYAIQKIAGRLLEHHVLRDEPLQGYGCFVYQQGTRALATEPLTIYGSAKVAHVEGAGSTSMSFARRATGEELQVVRVKGLDKIAYVQGELLVPSSCKWVPLPTERVKVAEDVGQASAFATARTAGHIVELVKLSSQTFQLRGELIEHLDVNQLSRPDAELMLGAMGAQKPHELLKQASDQPLRIPIVRPLKPLDAAVHRKLAQHERIVKVAREVGIGPSDLVPEMVMLFGPQGAQILEKTASQVGPNHETVDNVLSLRFLTPENASVYVDYLPEFVKTADRLAEILIASRIGMSDVRESSARNAMLQTQAVIDGLTLLRDKIQ